MTRPAYQERVLEEFSALQIKETKLDIFIKSGKFDELSDEEQILLKAQQSAMQTYMRILMLRMEHFGDE